MSGTGNVGGTDYESDAFAYVAAHISSELPLNWFGDERDVPIAVRAQSETAGHDLFMSIRGGGTIDLQAKHCATGSKDFISAAVRLIAALDPHQRA